MPAYCTICQQAFAGPIVPPSHLASRKHQLALVAQPSRNRQRRPANLRRQPAAAQQPTHPVALAETHPDNWTKHLVTWSHTAATKWDHASHYCINGPLTHADSKAFDKPINEGAIVEKVWVELIVPTTDRLGGIAAVVAANASTTAKRATLLQHGGVGSDTVNHAYLELQVPVSRFKVDRSGPPAFVNVRLEANAGDAFSEAAILNIHVFTSGATTVGGLPTI